MRLFITRAKIILALMLLMNLHALAEEDPNKKLTLLVVGMGYNQLSPATRQSLGEVNVVEVEFSPQWHRYIDQTDADKIILRHPSGYTGLYHKDGTLLRELGVNPASYAYPYSTPTTVTRPAAEDVVPTPDWHQTGYSLGGRTDPYRYSSPPMTKRNYQSLSPGWGYNREKTAPSRKDTLFQFLSFFPIDTVTPFNYPGTFDSVGVPTAYALGVVPHVGGLALELHEGKKQREIYDANNAALPEYVEYPVQMNNPQEPSNPFSQDPNVVRMTPMPQAFGQNHPQYVDKANYYYQYGSPMP